MMHNYVDNTLLGNMVGALRQARCWSALWKRAAKQAKREENRLLGEISLRDECIQAERLECSEYWKPQIAALQTELDESRKRYRKDTGALHEIQDLLVEQRNKLRAELASRDERRCETCKEWHNVSTSIATDDPAYGHYDSDEGHCAAFDAVMESGGYCSEWKARLL